MPKGRESSKGKGNHTTRSRNGPSKAKQALEFEGENSQGESASLKRKRNSLDRATTNLRNRVVDKSLTPKRGGLKDLRINLKTYTAHKTQMGGEKPLRIELMKRMASWSV